MRSGVIYERCIRKEERGGQDDKNLRIGLKATFRGSTTKGYNFAQLLH